MKTLSGLWPQYRWKSKSTSIRKNWRTLDGQYDLGHGKILDHPNRGPASGRANSPFLVDGEEVPVERAEDAERQQEEQQLAVDELVQGAPPHEQEAGEAPRGGGGHLILVAHRHTTLRQHMRRRRARRLRLAAGPVRAGPVPVTATTSPPRSSASAPLVLALVLALNLTVVNAIILVWLEDTELTSNFLMLLGPRSPVPFLPTKYTVHPKSWEHAKEISWFPSFPSKQQTSVLISCKKKRNETT
ncbi:Katanin-interacting protein [Frankliniella fusca]|uniref:Katanin-interacting protein n=1 Tax=Frankliniella fusca TaxID=407009 RepID=A0AAE1H3Z4_9NEOP|nr:Katanin-interacting protein [Frankliniella fusca]